MFRRFAWYLLTVVVTALIAGLIFTNYTIDLFPDPVSWIVFCYLETYVILLAIRKPMTALKLLQWSLSLVMLFFLVWALLTFNMSLTGFSMLGLLVVMPFNRFLTQLLKVRPVFSRGALFLIGLILLGLFYHVPFRECQEFIDKIDYKIDNSKLTYTSTKKQVDKVFSFTERAGIYQLHILMGLFGMPIFPEASVETLCMLLPSSKIDKKMELPVREFYINYYHITQSKTIKNLLESFADSSEQENVYNFEFENVMVDWGNNYYTDNTQIAFAFNPCYFTGIHNYSQSYDSHGFVNLYCTVPIDYGMNIRTVLIYIRGKPFILEQGLIWILIKTKWVYPYIAKWKII